MNSRTLLGMFTAILVMVSVLLVTNDGPSVIHSPEAMSQYPAPPATDLGAEVADHTSLLPPPTTAFRPSPSTTVAPEPEPTDGGAATTTTVAKTATTQQASTTTAAPGGEYNSSYENSFASLINDHRSANALGALSRDSSLDAEARAWSKSMAQSGSLSHSDLGRFLPPWSTVGENVGYGGSVGNIFSSLVASSGHNANMLNAAFTAFGIGVWVDADGVVWTTHVFAG